LLKDFCTLGGMSTNYSSNAEYAPTYHLARAQKNQLEFGKLAAIPLEGSQTPAILH